MDMACQTLQFTWSSAHSKNIHVAVTLFNYMTCPRQHVQHNYHSVNYQVSRVLIAQYVYAVCCESPLFLAMFCSNPVLLLREYFNWRVYRFFMSSITNLIFLFWFFQLDNSILIFPLWFFQFLCSARGVQSVLIQCSPKLPVTDLIVSPICESSYIRQSVECTYLWQSTLLDVLPFPFSEHFRDIAFTWSPSAKLAVMWSDHFWAQNLSKRQWSQLKQR